MEGSNVCETDMQCVKTSGGTRWCTGPKTDECYSYDYVSEVWNQAPVSLSKARAYAASVVLPNEELWISGGAGKKSILTGPKKAQCSKKSVKNEQKIREIISFLPKKLKNLI